MSAEAQGGFAAAIVQPARPTDAAEILELQKLAYHSEAAIYNEYGIPPLTQTLDGMRADLDRQTCLKAIVDDGRGVRIVGSVRAYLDQGTCYIGRLVVHPDLQNQGIGTRLMREIERLFGHAARFELFTGHLSERNLYLYDKLGYRPFKQERISDALTLVYLEKWPPAPGRDLDPGGTSV
jgi:ribosomal protein S18 acetylase RimI-like enzyme